MYEFVEDSNIIEEDYYAFLNVSKEASAEEIASAYRRLSKIYHPDRHTDPKNKKEAENLFSKTKKAYEILSDPHQRAIYDSVGVKGLETRGWEVVQKMKTPQEIKEEYERFAKVVEELKLERRTNATGTVKLSIDATDLFSEYDASEYDEFDESSSLIPNIEISGISFAQSVHAPITPNNIVTISGSVETENGRGRGSVNLVYRKIRSVKSWMEWRATFGTSPAVGMKLWGILTRKLDGTFGVTCRYLTKGLALGCEGGVSYKLGRYYIGFINCSFGLENSMYTGITRNTKFSTTIFSLNYGLLQSYASFVYIRRYYEDDEFPQFKLKAQAGTFGYFMEWGAVTQLSRQSTLGANVRFGIPSGVSLRIRFTRANQVYSFPILLSQEVIPGPLFYATVTPLFAWLILKKLVIEPIKRDQLEKSKERQREANKKRLAELRREATATRELMKETFTRIRHDEENKRGLVVVNALYGRIPPQGPQQRSAAAGERADLDSEVIDVTVQLQVLVNDSKLILHGSSKSQLPGFYDPCVGDEKSLFIQYLFHNNLHQVTLADTEPVRLPKNSHRVTAT